MAAITYSGGVTWDDTLTGDLILKCWKSPATMDSADTVAVPTVTGRTAFAINCYDMTTGDVVTTTGLGTSGTPFIIDAAGGTTDHTYLLIYGYY